MDLRTLSRTHKNESVSQPRGETVRADAPAHRVPPPRRRWVTRVLLPLAILLSTLALVGYAARDMIMPSTTIDVVRATALTRVGSDAGGNSGEGGDRANLGPVSVVAQAPGWVEPAPYPTYVSVLSDGVVAQVLVLEGDEVVAGQPVVELVPDDAELGLALAQAELARWQAVQAAAEADFGEPIALVRAEAVARAHLAQAEAALVHLDAQVVQEEAKLTELTAIYDRLAAVDERSASAQQVEAAMYHQRSQIAVVEATRQLRPGLEAGVQSARAEFVAAARKLELKIELQQARDEAAAQAAGARVRVAEAQLRLDRMTILSPTNGIVMNRLVAPGDKLMLGGDGMYTAHAIHLYDPASLQVRVDVPLADAASVGVGQQAIIVVDVLPDVEFRGVVTRLVHQADIGKNTVQFKVAITDPSPLLTPDMLARVKFMGRPGVGTPRGGAIANGGNTNAGEGSPVALRRSAIIESEGAVYVWWVSPTDSRLVRKPVTLGQERADDTVEVLTGLNPGDAIVDNPAAELQEGQRVRIRDGT